MNRPCQLLVFCLESRLYGLRLEQVNRVIHAVDATPLPQAPQIVLGAIDYHGQILPVFNVRLRFGLGSREIGLDDQFIIARTVRRTVVLAVDSVKGVFEGNEDQIVRAQQLLPRLDQIDGMVQLEDGLTLIHDIDRFLSLDEERALDQAMTTEPAHEN